MRIEILLMIITATIVSYIYTDGAIVRQVMAYKKYYQIGGVILGVFVLYTMIKKEPARATDLLRSGSAYMSYLPVDRNVTSFFEPLIDMTTGHRSQGQGFQDVYAPGQPIMSGGNLPATKAPVIRGGDSAGRFKRSLSEGKKKYVASLQKWKCKICGELLDSTYEADHIVRLQYGGSNDLSNIQVLCKSCHAQKTQRESLGL